MLETILNYLIPVAILGGVGYFLYRKHAKKAAVVPPVVPATPAPITTAEAVETLRERYKGTPTITYIPTPEQVAARKPKPGIKGSAPSASWNLSGPGNLLFKTGQYQVPKGTSEITLNHVGPVILKWAETTGTVQDVGITLECNGQKQTKSAGSRMGKIAFKATGPTKALITSTGKTPLVIGYTEG